MVASHNCPLCTDNYEKEADLLVHLEVEHRKSELAMYAVESRDRRTNPVVEDRQPTPPA